MKMGRKIWLALALAVVVTVSFAAGAVAAKHKPASDPRPKTVTKGLDYFHARQKSDGGFGTMAATAWVILGAVASGERIGSDSWTIGGKNPFDFLQAHSHEAAATGADVDNAPVYYARAIMSYVAVDRAERVFVAGTPARRPPGQALWLPGPGRRLAHEGQLLAVHLEPHLPGRPHDRLGDPSPCRRSPRTTETASRSPSSGSRPSSVRTVASRRRPAIRPTARTRPSRSRL